MFIKKFSYRLSSRVYTPTNAPRRFKSATGVRLKRPDQSLILFRWLGRRFLNRTFSMQEDDPVVDVEEIRKLLDEDIEEGGSE